MSGKAREAIVLGIGIWIAGAVLFAAFTQMPGFSTLVLPITFLTAPAMWLVARFHLRNVALEERVHAGLRLGAIITATQCLLDGGALFVIFRAGRPAFSPAAREATTVAMAVGYFWMLVVPWWEGKRTSEGE